MALVRNYRPCACRHYVIPEGMALADENGERHAELACMVKPVPCAWCGAIHNMHVPRGSTCPLESLKRAS